MGEIVHVSTSSHWYDKSGNPCFDADLRVARKQYLLASITTILREKAKQALVSYQIESAILASLTLPAIDGESYMDRAKRIAKDAAEGASRAAEIGTAVHRVIEEYARKLQR